MKSSSFPLPYRAWVRGLFVLLGIWLGPLTALASPAARLFIAIPCTTVCPGPVYYVEAQAGFAVALIVVAVDANGETDTSYSGTVTFGSSDLAASLPPSYTFTPADQGSHFFPDAAVFRTAGDQSISVQDSENPGIRGVWPVRVFADVAAIPGLEVTGKVMSILFLAVAGAWLISRQR